MAHYSIIQRVCHIVFVSEVGAVKIVPKKVFAVDMVHGGMIIIMVTVPAIMVPVGTVLIVISAADMEPTTTPVEYANGAIPVGVVQIVPKKVLAAIMVLGTILLTEVTVTAVPVGAARIVPNKVLAVDMVLGTILLTEVTVPAIPVGAARIVPKKVSAVDMVHGTTAEEVTVPAIPVGAVQIVPKKVLAAIMVLGTTAEEVTVPAISVGTVLNVINAADMDGAIVVVRECACAIPVGVVQIVPQQVIAAIMVCGTTLLTEVIVPAITVGTVQIVPNMLIAVDMVPGMRKEIAVPAIPIGTVLNVINAADMGSVMMPIRKNVHAIAVGAVMIAINATDMEAVMMPIREYAHNAIPVGAVQIVPKKVIAAIMVRGTTLLMAGDIVNVIAVSPAIIAIKKKRLRVFNMIAIS